MFGFRSGVSVAGPRQDGPPARPAEVMAPRRCCRYRNNLICLDDALSPAPPLSAEDARTILAKLRPELDRSDETGAAVVLIGGQAVLFWQRQLGTGDDPDGIVETRGDIESLTGVLQLVGAKRGRKPAWWEGLRGVGRVRGVCLQAELGDALGFGHV